MPAKKKKSKTAEGGRKDDGPTFDNVSVRFEKGFRNQLAELAEHLGLSQNQLIRNATEGLVKLIEENNREVVFPIEFDFNRKPDEVGKK